MDEVDRPRAAGEGGPAGADASFSPDWYARLSEAEPAHFWFRARRARIVREAAALLAGRSAHRIAELGCGTAFVLAALGPACRARVAVGVDAFAEGLRIAAGRGCAVAQAEAAAPPFAPGTFDLVCLLDVLEHCADDAAALAGAVGLLAPGGFLLATVPADPALWSAFDLASGHHRRYGPEGLAALAAGAGLVEVRVAPFFALLHPLLRRRRAPVAGTAPDPAADLRIVPGLNMLMRLALGAEDLLARAGLRFSRGSSLLLTARR